MHEQDDREWSCASGCTQIANELELAGIESDLFDSGWLGLPCTSGEEQQDSQQNCGQPGEGLFLIGNDLGIQGELLMIIRERWLCWRPRIAHH